jgi:tellurite resistance protein TerC
VSTETAAWLVTAVLTVALLAVDLVAFRPRGGGFTLRRAAVWSVCWTALGLGFAIVLIPWRGGEQAQEYLAGFLIEKSLSLDNVFLFALVFSYFAVPPAFQPRVLFWGIVGALALRGLFILVGAALLDAFHATIYVFGAFLILTGVRMARHGHAAIHPERNPALRLFRRLVPMTPDYRGERFLVREGGAWQATPLLGALVLVATFDVVFAIDSIPAIFAVTREPFIVFAANAFSLLGLSALYFLLAGMMQRFAYLDEGVAVILVFVGAKMVLADVFTVPIWLSLTVIVGTLALAAAASLVRSQPRLAERRAS